MLEGIIQRSMIGLLRRILGVETLAHMLIIITDRVGVVGAPEAIQQFHKISWAFKF